MTAALPSGASAARLARVLIGFVLIWVVLDRSAALLDSTLGEAGLIVCALVLAAAVATEVLLFKRSVPRAARALGLGRPTGRAILVASLVSALLLAFYPVFSVATGVPLALRDDWLWLVPGLLAQAGVAEELVFRGYLFRHCRADRSFWRAAFLSMVPFTAVHLLLFVQLDPAIALASTALAVVISFPLAHLFELGRNSIWGPALLHLVIQGSIKLVEAPGGTVTKLAVAWIGASAVLPFIAFAFRANAASSRAMEGSC